MHRARQMLSPILALLPSEYDFYQPRIRFVSIPKNSLSIQGSFEELLGPLCDSAMQNAGSLFDLPADRVLFPIHELQIPNIRTKFCDAVILPEEFSVLASALANIRFANNLSFPLLKSNLTLSIGR